MAQLLVRRELDPLRRLIGTMIVGRKTREWLLSTDGRNEAAPAARKLRDTGAVECWLGW